MHPILVPFTSNMVEPQYNEGPRDLQKVFVITRFHYIEVLFHIFYYRWGKEKCSLYQALYRDSLYQGSTVPLIHLAQKNCKCGEIYLPPYMAQGVYFRFQVTGMMEWGQKSKHKKILWASNNS